MFKSYIWLLHLFFKKKEKKKVAAAAVEVAEQLGFHGGRP